MRCVTLAFVLVLLGVGCGGVTEQTTALGGSGGGAGSAGSGGSGGGSAGSAGSGGAPGATPECTRDEECTLFDDCCRCEGQPRAGRPTPSCDQQCLQSSCSARRITQARCIVGRCVAAFECDEAQVRCRRAAPACPPRQLPEIREGCYTGDCVDAAQCRSASHCMSCMNAGMVCAAIDRETGPEAHCVTVPSRCNGDFSCACLGPSVCIAPFDTCTDFSGLMGLHCSCPNC